jgi:NADPH-dependent F420 reductase
MRIGFIGGTGPEGKGLAYRFALAGHEIIVGSRSADRAQEAASEIVGRAAGASILGAENADAAGDAEIVILTVPYDAQAATLPPLAAALAGKTVVSTGVPMAFAEGSAALVVVPEGSAAEQAQSLLPGAAVIGAFQNLGAKKLWGDKPLDQDVIVCGDAGEAKTAVMQLAGQIAGVRAVDGGALASARYVEAITVLLVSVNKRYKVTAGVKIAGLPDA